jgi:hypothetical protein
MVGVNAALPNQESNNDRSRSVRNSLGRLFINGRRRGRWFANLSRRCDVSDRALDSLPPIVFTFDAGPGDRLYRLLPATRNIRSARVTAPWVR